MLKARVSHITAVVLAILFAAGCDGPQSTLAPAGDAAFAIAEIWWVMLIGSVILFVLVIGLFAFALLRRGRGPQLTRPFLFIAGGGLLMPTVVLAALLVYGVIASRDVTSTDVEVDRVIAVTGHRWFWEFAYLDDDGAVLRRSRDFVIIPARRMVEFRVTSNDVIHGFWIPRLGGKIDAIPGRINTLRLRANGDGPISGQCAEFCGIDHAHMRFDVRVVDDASFARWIGSGIDDTARAATDD